MTYCYRLDHPPLLLPHPINLAELPARFLYDSDESHAIACAAAQQATSNQPIRRELDSSKRVRSAKRNVGIRIFFLFFHIMVGTGLTYSSLWPANAMSFGECQVRLVKDLHCF
jgi:hypothetical protein